MKVTELNVYPVKSCAGISVATAACNDMGLLYDRYFMVVHATSKRMLTQRQLPRMALITVEIDPSILDGTRTGTDASLVMRAPDVSPLTVPLHPPADLQPEALTTCQVWSWKGPAYDMGDEASAWLTHVLGKPTRLFRCLGACVVVHNDQPRHKITNCHRPRRAQTPHHRMYTMHRGSSQSCCAGWCAQHR